AIGRRPDEIDDALETGGAKDRIDLRHLLEDLGAVTLGETAGDDQGAAATVALQLRQLQDRVDRLLARAIDERARVDDHALGVFDSLDERMAGRGETAEHQLRIDLILRTAERGEVDLHAARGQIVRRLSKLSAMPKSLSRTSFMTSCRSSRLFPAIRT